MAEPVIVSLEELQKGLSGETLTKAFGPDSLGLILVNQLPEKYQPLRMKVLKSISTVANLEPEVLKTLECEESTWLTGWSCGREVLASTGQPDLNKGSYYVNCAFYKDDSLEGPSDGLCAKFADHKTYTSPNIWPPQNAAGLETFKEDAKVLVSLIIDVASLVATNCDSLMRSQNVYDSDYLHNMVKNSTCTKARMLHYFPTTGEATNDDDWCGEHLDHSCITGLTSALFLDECRGLHHDLPKSPDPSAGLYIKDRHGQVHHVNIPADCLAFQTGSALEEVTRHNFKAVPHYVKGARAANIARNTLAVFCQPDLDQMVNDTENFAAFSNRVLQSNHQS